MPTRRDVELDDHRLARSAYQRVWGALYIGVERKSTVDPRRGQMDFLWSFAQQFLTATAAVAVTGFFFGRVFEARIKARFDRAMEDYRFRLRSHEQGAKIAEYVSLVGALNDGPSPDLFRRANQLSWELFLWLPTDTYRKLGRGLKGDSKALAHSMTDVREILLAKEAGSLGIDDIISHGPSIGR